MKIRVLIAGITPLLMNKYYEASEAISEPEIEAENHAYRNKETQELEMPYINLLSCLKSAGRNFKLFCGEKNLEYKSILPAAINYDEETISLNTQKYVLDSRQVRCRKTGERILRHRPKILNWKMSFEIELNERLLSEEILHELFDYAGSVIGIGEFRPEKNGPFGKFKVEDWIISKPKKIIDIWTSQQFK